MNFYVQNRSSRPKIEPPCQFQQFWCMGKIFHFQNFWDASMRKEQQQPPWLTNFAKMWPKGVSRIKTKSHQVWASQDKRFLIGSCEASEPPPPGLIGLSSQMLGVNYNRAWTFHIRWNEWVKFHGQLKGLCKLRPIKTDYFLIFRTWFRKNVLTAICRTT